jgi:hypothetical protein
VPDDAGKLRPRLPSPRTLALLATALCLGLTVALHWFAFPSDPLAPASSGSVSASPPTPPVTAASNSAPPIPAVPSVTAEVAEVEPPSPVVEKASEGEEPRAPVREVVRNYSTVQQAAAQSCTTESVAGLSRQIIAQARCIEPNAFVPLPSRPNLHVESNVFPYLERNARDQLVKALDSKKDLKMTLNSALRTVAQQYLVWRWAAGKRCGVPLATRPGESNHELGSAIDIAEPTAWRATLEAYDFKWLGASDRVHFDFTKSPRRKATDVLAFQKLWNKNKPQEKIPETGRFDAKTEDALKRAPPKGFPIAPSCGKR